ncbi:hypothetical protein GIB67_021749 [Kingdonia uniflora]|uniref:Uncharacterized protein n=1 Tax=Kingdonia uniflora TaxID=39325 RepID=A0A7J7M9L0_9MAGN|nr:hypothetical protein GIB67_021749 [Kingdonia uniflora]
MMSNKSIYKYTSCKLVLIHTPVTSTTNYTLITTVALSAISNKPTSGIQSHVRVNTLGQLQTNRVIQTPTRHNPEATTS